MKQIRTKKTILFSVMLTVILTLACRRDVDPDITAPGYQIGVSETLAIPAAVDLPANLPAGNSRTATFFAEGVQKYKAQQIPGVDPVAYQWAFVAPKADLYDATNKKVGTHGAGPNWQLSVADTIYGQQFTPVRSAASLDQSSIDWLQLMPKTGTTPTGIFSGTAYIQRIATKGGKAPATPPASINDTIDMKYTAIYRFSKKNP